MSNNGKFKIKFHPEALAEWREVFPDLPPGDEIALWAKHEPCSVCGNEICDLELGAFDIESISSDGTVSGTHYCMKCVEEGH